MLTWAQLSLAVVANVLGSWRMCVVLCWAPRRSELSSWGEAAFASPNDPSESSRTRGMRLQQARDRAFSVAFQCTA
jgi:hypothetical protein